MCASPDWERLAAMALRMSPTCQSRTVIKALESTANETPYVRAKYGLSRSGPTSA